MWHFSSGAGTPGRPQHDRNVLVQRVRPQGDGAVVGVGVGAFLLHELLGAAVAPGGGGGGRGKRSSNAGTAPSRDALEGKGPQRRPQKRLDGRLEEVIVGYKCR